MSRRACKEGRMSIRWLEVVKPKIGGLESFEGRGLKNLSHVRHCLKWCLQLCQCSLELQTLWQRSARHLWAFLGAPELLSPHLPSSAHLFLIMSIQTTWAAAYSNLQIYIGHLQYWHDNDIKLSGSSSSLLLSQLEISIWIWQAIKQANSIYPLLMNGHIKIFEYWEACLPWLRGPPGLANQEPPSSRLQHSCFFLQWGQVCDNKIPRYECRLILDSHCRVVQIP